MSVLKSLVKTYRRRYKRWPSRLAEQPWFDQPNAMQLLEQRRKTESLPDEDFEHLRHWCEHGYVVTQGSVPEPDIDEMMADIERVWTAAEPIPGLSIDSLRVHPDDSLGVPHSKLVTLDQETRERLRRGQRWRIHGFYQYSASANRIRHNLSVQRLASLILGREGQPHYTINFTFGSSQDLHQDTSVFFVWPRNFLVGSWLACEDIHPDSGPLVYYPGSHKEPLFPAFDNYPQTNLKTCPKPMMAAYNEYVETVAKNYERKVFVARKGEIFLWHGMLIHGGSAIRNPELTRRSYVTHYIPQHYNVESQMEGPFNW